MSIPVLIVTGRSGSGKTTLLEKLLAELGARGDRVAVVKHTRHRDVTTDSPGTDTRRYWEAGAVQTVLVAPDRVMSVRRHADEPPLAAVISQIREVDLILVEGYKGAAVEKIEVVRAACDPLPIPGLVGRIAFVTDVSELGCDWPCFGLEDVAGLADFVEAWMRDAARRSESPRGLSTKRGV